jgi:hypothetical protein
MWIVSARFLGFVHPAPLSALPADGFSPLRFDDLEHLTIAVLQRVDLHAPDDVLAKVEVDGLNLHPRGPEVAWETVHLHARAEDPCIIADVEEIYRMLSTYQLRLGDVPQSQCGVTQEGQLLAVPRGSVGRVLRQHH